MQINSGLGAIIFLVLTVGKQSAGRIDLAAETFALPEVAAKIIKATGKRVSAVTLSKEESLAKPHGELGYRHETWNNIEGYNVDLDAVRGWGLPLTMLDQFIEHNRDKFVVG